MIPARSELTSRYQIMERKTYFLEFNTKYESMHQLGPWIALPLDKLPKEVVEKLIKKLPELPPMSFEKDKRIGDIDKDYPIEIPIPVLFACQIGGLILLLLGGMGMGWKIYKIALCGLRWFKLNVSKYQKDVKLSKRCQVVKKMSNVKK